MNFIIKKIDIIFLTFIVLFFFGDVVTSIIHKLNGEYFSRYSGLVKLIFEGIMCVVILTKIKKEQRLLIALLFLALSFVISQLLLLPKPEYDFYQEFMGGNIYYFNRYIYVSIFILFTKTVLIREETYKKVYVFLEYYLYVNALAILLGAIFEIEVFRSFEYSERLGYTGLLAKPGEASYFYMIVILYNYYFWNSVKKLGNLYKMLFFIVFSLFLGQKKVLLFLVLLGILHFFYYSKHRKYFRIGLPIILGLLIFYVKPIFNLLLQKLPFWNKIYEKDGLMAMLTSHRSALLERAVEYIELNWTIGNYLFGGIDFRIFKAEFELFDLYIFLGVSGVLYYFFILLSFLRGKSILVKQLICIVFLTSFASGGLILNISAIILFYVTIKKFYLINTTETQSLLK